MPGDNVQMEIELIQPIAMDQGLRFAIREGGRTVGSGVVTEIINSTAPREGSSERQHIGSPIRLRQPRRMAWRHRRSRSPTRGFDPFLAASAGVGGRSPRPGSEATAGGISTRQQPAERLRNPWHLQTKTRSRIRLKAYDTSAIESAAKEIVETATRTGATVSGPVPLPTEKNVYCVIRSPFKDKDSREHFEIRTHKRLIDIHQPTPRRSTRSSASTTCRLVSTSRSAWPPEPTYARHPRQEARYDPGLPGGWKRRARDRTAGRAVPGDRDPHARARRLRRRSARVRGNEEKHLSKAELGHLKKADAPPMRHLARVSRRGGRGVGGLELGGTVTVESFEAGARVKISGTSKGKAFRERSSATTSPAARKSTARTTSARPGRSAPRRRPRA